MQSFSVLNSINNFNKTIYLNIKTSNVRDNTNIKYNVLYVMKYHKTRQHRTGIKSNNYNIIAY